MAADRIPVEECHYLYGAIRSKSTVQQRAAELVAEVAARPRGFLVAVDLLRMWLGTTELGSHEQVARLRPICRAVLGHVEFGDSQSGSGYEVALVAKIGLAGPEAEPLAQDLVRALRVYVRANPSSWEEQHDLVQVMFRHQPAATLSALYEGGVEDWELSIQLLRHFTDDNHPAKLLDAEALVAWCASGCQAKRHIFALKLVPAVEAEMTPGRAPLTPQTRALLDHSPCPKGTLKRLVANLSPQSWSGSRAAIMEINATALDDVLDLFDADFQKSAKEAKTQLPAIIAEDREEETKRERTRDERFE